MSRHTSLLLLLALPLSPVSAAISDNLIGYYPFETDTNNAITSGGLPNGTTVNSPAPATAGGLVGNAMSLQGADNDHMNLAASFGTGNTLGENFTISAWYKLNDPISSTNTTNRYFVYEASNNFDVSYGLRDNGDGVAGINDGQVYTDGSNFDIADTGTPGWHHVVQTYTSNSGTTTIRTYIDGTHAENLTLPTTDLSGNGFNFGAARSSQTNRGFDGLIDEVAIWDRALASDELATVFALGLNSKPLITNDPPSTAPVINSFTASPTTVLLGGNTTLDWNVSGASSVTIVDGLNNVASSGNQSVTINEEKTFTLVAINGNTTQTAQVTVNIGGPTDPVGPYVGTVKNTEAYFLFRPGPEEINLRLTVMTEAGTTVTSVDSTSLATNDHVAKFHATGLTPGIKYLYKIEKIETGGGTTLFAGNTTNHYFKTVPTQRTGQVVTAAFISCVNDTTDALWTEMANHNLDLLCLAGDTPYVDTGNLASIRSKHRHFLQRPTLVPLLGKTSVVGTWDDHDFGLNNGNGVNTASRKVNTRRGFVEYRVHDQYGNGSDEGIYHKTDMGAMEVFLLDPRWFSQTAASPVDTSQSTCFGNEQWQWLLNAIRNSEAPFKILVQGQIWQDKKNSETDDMYTYWAERDALLNIIRDEKIPGVVLFGGDIHVARYLMHPQRVGYDLHDFIMSPGHKSVISSLNVYHPSLEWSRESQNQFLTMKADTTKSVPELTVRYLDQNGNINHELVIPYTQLTPREESGLTKNLRALWTFDNDLKNQSVLGSRIDASAQNGASIVASGGARGGALQLSRSNNQYISIPRSFIDDNTSAYTVSSWCKATTLPAHGSTDRHFIMESMVNNHTGLPQASTTGYAISLGISATTDAQKVNLQLFTETLDPKGVGSQQAPTRTAQGGFDWDVDRSVFSNWSHIVVTFDSNQLKLYINGALVKEHTLNPAAPIAETGGLIIGGHRSGTGRNFDGMIDEVAIWNRVLTDAEIASLFNSGTPPAIPTSASLPDTDGDALPDYWENIHGMDSNDNTDNTDDSDNDSLDAIQEFGFGTLPNKPDAPLPYQQTSVTLSDTEYQAITYQRDPAALDFLNVAVQRSTDLGIGDSWSQINTVVVSVTPLSSGLEQVVERSTVAMNTQNREFLRVQFSKKN